MRSNIFEKQLFAFVLFVPFFISIYEKIGQQKAWRVYYHAKKTVPGYRKFLGNASGYTTFSSIPETSKDTYIKRYPIHELCVGGKIPSHGVIIDESSGSSGTPTNWVRGKQEREGTKKMLQLSYLKRFGNKKMIFINAFAMGVWATGINITIGMVDIAIIKSTGPDLKKIVNTLSFFGSDYQYVIAGYPPFLKALADTTAIDFDQFHVDVIFGGEGVSEALRTYLLKSYNKVIGSYGASDLEINIAAETDFTIWLRQHIIENDELANALIIQDYGVTPMIFQYHMLDYLIETNDQGELVVTINKIDAISPRIRYNIQDLGHVLAIDDLKKILIKFGLSYPEKHLCLPLLFHYGRSTGSVAYYGSKIHPQDIQEALLTFPLCISDINSYAIDISMDENQNKILEIKCELYESVETIPDLDTELFFKELMRINQDFEKAWGFVPEDKKPTLGFYAYKADCFANENDNVKKRYMIVNK